MLEAEGLVGCAGIALALGKPGAAARWIGAADAASDLTGRGRYTNKWQYWEPVTAARERLGETGYAAAWAAGTLIPAKDAIAEAMHPAALDGIGVRAVGPYGLTRRELDVIRLMVAGRTNVEIATDLYISLNTVANHHVRQILAKLGVENRAAAVALALREGFA